MKILLASSEVHPFSKTGGLADMVGALAKALANAGQELHVVTPLYRGIREKFPKMRRVDWQFNLLLGANRGCRPDCGRWRFKSGLTVYFVDHPGFSTAPGIYFEDNISYADNAERFIFFSKCVGTSRPVSALAAGRGSCPRLAGRAGAGVDPTSKPRRRSGKSAPDLPDNPQPRVSGNFPAGRICPDESAGGIFLDGRRGVLRAVELPQGGDRFCRRHHDGQPALRARNHDGSIGLRPGRPAATAAKRTVRHFERRGLWRVEYDE